MGIKFQILKDAHLRAFLEDEYNVKIVKKYNAYLIVKDGTLITYLYTLNDVRAYLESGKVNIAETTAKVVSDKESIEDEEETAEILDNSEEEKEDE